MQRGLPKYSNDMIGQMIKIRTEFDTVVYGWVYLYDDSTKALALSKSDNHEYKGL